MYRIVSTPGGNWPAYLGVGGRWTLNLRWAISFDHRHAAERWLAALLRRQHAKGGDVDPLWRHARVAAASTPDPRRRRY